MNPIFSKETQNVLDKLVSIGQKIVTNRNQVLTKNGVRQEMVKIASQQVLFDPMAKRFSEGYIRKISTQFTELPLSDKDIQKKKKNDPASAMGKYPSGSESNTPYPSGDQTPGMSTVSSLNKRSTTTVQDQSLYNLAREIAKGEKTMEEAIREAVGVDSNITPRHNSPLLSEEEARQGIEAYLTGYWGDVNEIKEKGMSTVSGLNNKKVMAQLAIKYASSLTEIIDTLKQEDQIFVDARDVIMKLQQSGYKGSIDLDNLCKTLAENGITMVKTADFDFNKLLKDFGEQQISVIRQSEETEKELAKQREKECPKCVEKEDESEKEHKASCGCRMCRTADDRIPGGKGEGKDIKDFDKKQLETGTKIEKEHTDNEEVAQEIAKDHLSEHKNYYKKLIPCEKQMGQEGSLNKQADQDFKVDDYVELDYPGAMTGTIIRIVKNEEEGDDYIIVKPNDQTIKVKKKNIVEKLSSIANQSSLDETLLKNAEPQKQCWYCGNYDKKVEDCSNPPERYDQYTAVENFFYQPPECPNFSPLSMDAKQQYQPIKEEGIRHQTPRKTMEASLKTAQEPLTEPSFEMEKWLSPAEYQEVQRLEDLREKEWKTISDREGRNINEGLPPYTNIDYSEVEVLNDHIKQYQEVSEQRKSKEMLPTPTPEPQEPGMESLPLPKEKPEGMPGEKEMPEEGVLTKKPEALPEFAMRRNRFMKRADGDKDVLIGDKKGKVIKIQDEKHPETKEKMRKILVEFEDGTRGWEIMDTENVVFPGGQNKSSDRDMGMTRKAVQPIDFPEVCKNCKNLVVPCGYNELRTLDHKELPVCSLQGKPNTGFDQAYFRDCASYDPIVKVLEQKVITPGQFIFDEIKDMKMNPILKTPKESDEYPTINTKVDKDRTGKNYEMKKNNGLNKKSFDLMWEVGNDIQEKSTGQIGEIVRINDYAHGFNYEIKMDNGEIRTVPIREIARGWIIPNTTKTAEYEKKPKNEIPVDKDEEKKEREKASITCKKCVDKGYWKMRGLVHPAHAWHSLFNTSWDNVFHGDVCIPKTLNQSVKDSGENQFGYQENTSDK